GEAMSRKIENYYRKPVAQPQLEQNCVQAGMVVVAMQDEQRPRRRLIRADKVMTGERESRRVERPDVVLDGGAIVIPPTGEIEPIEIEVSLGKRVDERRGKKVDADQALSQACNISGSEHP